MKQLFASDGVGLVILGEFLRDIEALKTRLSSQNLRVPEGVNEALAIQGEIKGLNRAIDRLFELAEEKDND